MATAAALASNCTTTHLASDVKDSDIDVIDYKMNLTSSVLLNNNGRDDSEGGDCSKSDKISENSNGESGNKDFVGNLSSACNGKLSGCFGGRLQFFKNGKVILELARSKEGEKSRWISVPRKIFRSPSATSSTVTPTLVNSSAYTKNECSTSISFSDDNSSILSSPWQRDHCWKQLSPRSGISKAMSLYYQRPRSLSFTKCALLIARRKRRKPHDTTCLLNGMCLFENKLKMVQPNVGLVKEFTNQQNSRQQELNKVNEDTKCESERVAKTNNGSVKADLVSDEDGCSSSSTVTLTGNDGIDAQMENGTPIPSLTPTSCKDEKAITTKEVTEVNVGCAKKLATLTSVDKMYTSEEQELKTVTPEKLAYNINAEVDGTLVVKDNTDKKSDGGDCKESHSTKKHRLKLNAIVQKLIDSAPVRLAKLSKVYQPSLVSEANGSLPHKVSSPNISTATTRLVEFPQQHVSPRKRILREFERVSLEDNLSVAGGKRSRAKSNASSSSTSFQRSMKSSNCSSGFNVPMSSSGNGESRSSFSKSETTTQSVTTTPPARLYSSYSIHSLLGGSSSNSTISNSNVGTNNKKQNEAAIVSSMGYHQQHRQHSDPSYLRAMLASPKSPEQSNLSNMCSKSPVSSSKKRSPPYASPLRDAHTSDAKNVNNKMRYVSDNVGNLESSTMHSTSHMHSQIQKQQSFYTSYMSSKYVPSTSGSAVSATSSVSPNSRPRSPCQYSNFNEATSSSSTNIPVNHLASTSIGNSRESSSPPSRATTDIQHDSTPRTVPKKTVSIRQQFASPIGVGGSSGSLSPNERHAEELYSAQGRRTPVSATNSSSNGSKQLHGESPIRNTGHSPLPPHYYMYPAVHPNGASSPVSHTSAASPDISMSIASGGATNAAAAAAAAAAASYIPSMMSPVYMNPYFALAALRHTPQVWSHYGGPLLPFPLSSSGTSASARLSPPAFHNFPHSGMNAAMVAVMKHQQQQQMLVSSALLHTQLSPPSLATPNHPRNTGSERQSSPASVTDYVTDLAVNQIENDGKGLDLGTKNSAARECTTSFYSTENKEEHSLDVPLNLSKH